MATVRRKEGELFYNMVALELGGVPYACVRDLKMQVHKNLCRSKKKEVLHMKWYEAPIKGVFFFHYVRVS